VVAGGAGAAVDVVVLPRHHRAGFDAPPPGSVIGSAGFAVERGRFDLNGADLVADFVAEYPKLVAACPAPLLSVGPWWIIIADAIGLASRNVG